MISISWDIPFFMKVVVFSNLNNSLPSETAVSFKNAPEEYNFFKKNPFQICQFFNPGEQIK